MTERAAHGRVWRILSLLSGLAVIVAALLTGASLLSMQINCPEDRLCGEMRLGSVIYSVMTLGFAILAIWLWKKGTA